MIQIEFLLINVWQKTSVGEVWVIMLVEKKRRVEKKKKGVEKYAKKSFKVLLVEERVQNIEFGPNYCLNFPFVSKSWFLQSKWILSFNFITLLAIALRTIVILILHLLAITPSPVTTLNFILSVMRFNMWSLKLIWAYGVTGSRI